jgi:polar amino acid transport system permease protein
MTEADLARIAEYLPRLLRGAGVTVPIGLVAMALCTVLATLAAMSHHAGSRAVRTTGRIYIEVARGTPDIIQVYLWYYLLAEFGIKLPAIVAGVLALAFGHGGSLAEVVRGGIESVDRTQWDAGRVLGMRNWQIWLRVVLPQVGRVILPVWTGYFVAMFKATAFLSLVAVQELMGVADEIAFFNFRFFEVFGIALVIYAIIGTISIGLIKLLERRWSVERPRVRRDRVLEAEARVA